VRMRVRNRCNCLTASMGNRQPQITSKSQRTRSADRRAGGRRSGRRSVRVSKHSVPLSPLESWRLRGYLRLSFTENVGLVSSSMDGGKYLYLTASPGKSRRAPSGNSADSFIARGHCSRTTGCRPARAPPQGRQRTWDFLNCQERRRTVSDESVHARHAAPGCP